MTSMSKACFESLLGNVRWMSWGRPESTSREHTLDVSLKRLLNVISERPQDFRSERLQDGQIGSLCDILGTLQGDVLGTNICWLECNNNVFKVSNITANSKTFALNNVSWFCGILNLLCIFIVLITDIFHLPSNFSQGSIYLYRYTYFRLIMLKTLPPLWNSIRCLHWSSSKLEASWSKLNDINLQVPTDIRLIFLRIFLPSLLLTPASLTLILY